MLRNTARIATALAGIGIVLPLAGTALAGHHRPLRVWPCRPGRRSGPCDAAARAPASRSPSTPVAHPCSVNHSSASTASSILSSSSSMRAMPASRAPVVNSCMPLGSRSVGMLSADRRRRSAPQSPFGHGRPSALPRQASPFRSRADRGGRGRGTSAPTSPPRRACRPRPAPRPRPARPGRRAPPIRTRRARWRRR